MNDNFSSFKSKAAAMKPISNRWSLTFDLSFYSSIFIQSFVGNEEVISAATLLDIVNRQLTISQIRLFERSKTFTRMLNKIEGWHCCWHLCVCESCACYSKICFSMLYHGLRNLKLKKEKISWSEVYIFVFYILKGSSSQKIKIFGQGNQKLSLPI